MVVLVVDTKPTMAEGRVATAAAEQREGVTGGERVEGKDG